jgi:phosphoenolpyruvate-protein kinase (PTS system EI component)
VSILPILLGAAFAGLIIALWVRSKAKQQRRSEALTRLLDLADEMEALLNASQKKMQAMQTVVERVPSDIGALANASLDSNDKILAVKRDLLQHRLWIQQNSQTATQAEIDQACAALQRARDRIAEQIQALDAAGIDLVEATAGNELGEREPASLKRGGAE